MPNRFQNYINGEWVAGSSWSANRNPSDLSDIVGEYALADKDQTNAAVAAATRAFPAWSTGSIQDRANLLDKVGSDILARKGPEVSQFCTPSEDNAKGSGLNLPLALSPPSRYPLARTPLKFG